MRTIGKLLVIIPVIAVSIAAGIYITIPESETGDVFVMYAGSLVKTFEGKIGPTFEEKYDYNYLGEGRGALQLANMIIDQQRSPDVFVSAGTIPVRKLMYHDPPLAHWLIKFASAEMVIAYTPNSPFFNDLEKARKGEVPWYEVLAKDEMRFRRTDPELDPKGYYMVIVAKLANLHYDDPTIKDRILGEDRDAEQILPEETLKSALESGQIDASAAYKHEAVARELPYITLPEEINLSDSAFAHFYKEANYTLVTGTTVHGDIIPFCVTIPETRKNEPGAEAFVKFLLSDRSMEIMEQGGLYPLKFEAEGDVSIMPASIRNTLGG